MNHPPKDRGATNRSRAGRPAGIVSRGLAGLIDVGSVAAVMAVLYLGWVLIRVVTRPRSFRWPALNLWFSTTEFLVLSIIYLTFWWAISGRTVGNAVLGVRLTPRSGGRVGWPVALLRACFCAIFPVGLIWVAVGKKRRSLQDIALRTAVVYESPATPNTVAQA